MLDSKKINNSIIRLEMGDITDKEVEAFVFYAQSDLKLGSGFGNAIAMRGGLSISKELEQIGSIKVGEAVVTVAGKLKAQYIVHANGPKFQENDTESKLKETILNSLKAAEEKGIKQMAFPAMGAGFYGIPLPVCADIMIDTIKGYLEGKTNLNEVIICLLDNREYEPFKAKLETI
ncbi:MAG: macro domain-containing protein [candidate division Zixibacteria bacterium]|nr:macro domain-containing protein [Candidatus Tariuqbacter arcticus]